MITHEVLRGLRFALVTARAVKNIFKTVPMPMNHKMHTRSGKFPLRKTKLKMKLQIVTCNL